MNSAMETKENELKLYYNSAKKRDRETLGYAESLDVRLNDRDLSKNNLTPRQFAELAESLGTEVRGLVDENADMFLNELKDKKFSEEEWLKLLSNNPDLVKTPVALIGKKVYYVDSPFNLIPEDLDIEGVKSEKGEKSESGE